MKNVFASVAMGVMAFVLTAYGDGTVKVADAGVVQITNAPTAYSTASKTFVLARGSSITAPADWSGWSVSPSSEDVSYAFSAAGGVFKLTVKGGIVIIFR